MSKKVTIAGKPTPAPAADAWVETRTPLPDPAEETKRLTVDIPEPLHRKIRIACATRGTRMADEIRVLLEARYGDHGGGVA